MYDASRFAPIRPKIRPFRVELDTSGLTLKTALDTHLDTDAPPFSRTARVVIINATRSRRLSGQ
jgi:hypothetical protein